jgi:serine/threonine protein kinase
VLYEMLTGQPAFAGENVNDTLAAVVRSEPAWDALPAAVSPTLRAFLRYCLHKDPQQRVGDIRDMRLVLEGAFDNVIVERGDVEGHRSTFPRIWMAAAVVGVAAAVSLSVIHFREAAHRRRRCFQIHRRKMNSSLFRSFPRTASSWPSPLAFQRSLQVTWIRALDSLSPNRCRAPGRVTSLLSPDSRTIGFSRMASSKDRFTRRTAPDCG